MNLFRKILDLDNEDLSLNNFREKTFNTIIFLIGIFMGISMIFVVQNIIASEGPQTINWFILITYIAFLSLPALKFLNFSTITFIFNFIMIVLGMVLFADAGLEGIGRTVIFFVPIVGVVLTTKRNSWILFGITIFGYISVAAYKIIFEFEPITLWISSCATSFLGLIASMIVLTRFYSIMEGSISRFEESEQELLDSMTLLEDEINERARSETLNRSLFNIADIANSSKDLDEVFKRIHKVIQGLISTENFYIALYDPETQIISFPYWVHEKEPPQPPRVFSFGFTEEIIRNGEPLLLDREKATNMLESRRGRKGKFETRIPASWLGIPLLSTTNEILGVLAVQNYDEKNVYTEEDLEILMFVSSQIGMAIQVKLADERQKEINLELERKVSERTSQLETELEERSRIELELLRERQLFIEGPVVSIRWDINNYFTPTYISPNISRYGYSSEEILSGKITFRDIIHPADIDRLDEEIKFHKEAMSSFYEQEFRIVSPEGEIFWIYDFTTVSRHVDGTITGIDTYLLNNTERRKFEVALQLKTAQQTELIEVAQQLTEPTAIEVVLERIASGAYQILRAQGCSVYKLEPDRRTLLPLVAIDPAYEDEIMSAKIDVESSFTGQAILQRKGLVFNDPYSESVGTQIPGTPVETNEKLICVPFIYENRILGVMTIFRYDMDFTEDELSLAETFAAYAASAINSANHLESLEREIEERKRIEAQLDMQANALQATHSPIIITDPEGNIEWVNPAFTRISGYEFGEIRGQNMSILNSGKHDFGFYENLWDTILSGQVWQGEITNRSKMDRVFTVETTINPVWSEDRANINHFVAIQQDISEKKQQERERNAFVQVSAELRNAANTQAMSPIILDNLMDLLNVKAAAHVVVDPTRHRLKVELGKGAWSHWNGMDLPYNKGIPGKVIQTRDWYMSNNVKDDPDVADTLDMMEELYHQICTPLIINKNVVGVLWVANDISFTYDEAKILMTISEMASNAISRALQHEETQLRVERLKVLRQVDMAIAGSNEMNIALNVVTEQAINNLGVDAASILVFDSMKDKLHYRASAGFDYPMLDNVKLHHDQGLIGEVIQKRRTCIC